MKLLLLFLCCCTPVFAQSITISDVNPPYTGNLVALTPSTVVEPSGSGNPSLIWFQSTVPSNRTPGEAYTFSLSFDGYTISGSGNSHMPSYAGFGFFFPANTDNGVHLKAITQDFAATITVSFANGGTA